MQQKIGQIAHRGYWKTPDEKNSIIAFKRALQWGFGIETDLRDHNGKIVIAHDLPTGNELPFEDFLELYTQETKRFDPAHAFFPKLALNLKADGLQSKISAELKRFEVNQYFLFDASVPDLLGCLHNKLTTYTRQSEYENQPSLLDRCTGVWLDQFESTWFSSEQIMNHLRNGKEVCVVSAELHGRNHQNTWAILKEVLSKPEFSQCLGQGMLTLCTDLPENAQETLK